MMLTIEVILRLLLAVVVGGLIGYEREFKNRPAGFRTHILVCVGAAVTSLIELYSINATVDLMKVSTSLESSLKIDIGRLGAQVITGVGFLGAGTIIHDKGSVKGLTTAASIWCVACIGLAAGLGYYSLTILSTLCVFLVLVMLKKFEQHFIDRTKIIKLQIYYKNYASSVQYVIQYFEKRDIKIKNIEFSLEHDEEGTLVTLYSLIAPREIDPYKIAEEMRHIIEIIDVKVT